MRNRQQSHPPATAAPQQHRGPHQHQPRSARRGARRGGGGSEPDLVAYTLTSTPEGRSRRYECDGQGLGGYGGDSYYYGNGKRGTARASRRLQAKLEVREVKDAWELEGEGGPDDGLTCDCDCKLCKM